MIGIIKSNDERNYFLSKMIKDAIYSDNVNDFINIDVLIIPPLGCDSFLYCKNTNISLRNIVKNNEIKMIISGLNSKQLEDFTVEQGIKLITYLDKREVINDNARLTAEGLLRIIGSDLKTSLADNHFLILGYGYCAQAVINYLKPYNCKISVFAKDYHDKKNIFINNHSVKEDLNDLKGYDIIINTIPSVLINEKSFSSIDYDTKLYDIASYPYGFDLDYAKKHNYKVNVIPGIPGLIIPKSAALVIYKYLCAQVKI